MLSKFKIIKLILVFACTLQAVNAQYNLEKDQKLKSLLHNKFYLGTALSNQQIAGRDNASLEVVKAQFNAIVPENCMKSGLIQPEQGKFNFEMADKFVEFGEKNGMFITGHTLIWHSQTPRWFFKDSLGQQVSREELIKRMKNHITTVVTRYKGRVKGWDVVNEAIEDDGSFRKSPFYNIIGPEFIAMAFKFAHEADPDAELYYNDYSMAIPEKRNGVVNMVKSLQQQGVVINGIGMQGHVSINTPELEEFEKSIIAYSELGVHVMITEFDISVLPSPWEKVGAEVSANFQYSKETDPYKDGLPSTVENMFNDRCLDFFKLFVKYDQAITRVTFWGVNDSDSWKNNWPVRGRTDYPLLFDRNNNPKSVVDVLKTYLASN